MCKKTFKAFLTGGIIGFIAGILFAPQEGEKTRQELKEKIEEFKKLYEEKEVEKKVRQIFGKVSERAKEIYFSAQIAVVEGLSELKGKAAEIDKEKYASLIKSRLELIAKRFNLDSKTVEKLKKALEEKKKELQSLAKKFSKKGTSVKRRKAKK